MTATSRHIRVIPPTSPHFSVGLGESHEKVPADLMKDSFMLAECFSAQSPLNLLRVLLQY